MMRWFVLLVLVGAGIVGCVQFREFVSPDVGGEWKALLADIRAFERRIGYADTTNFADVAVDRTSFPFCGRVSSLYLPYSYQDPAISWPEGLSEAECKDVPPNTDVYHGTVEAWGEIGTPVTPAMIAGKLDRFVYLVIHEDCHDQFELPYGIEEALCNVIAYRAMELFSAEKFRWFARENRVIRSYTSAQSRQTRATISIYRQVETLYARYRQGELTIAAMLEQRAALFARAETALETSVGAMNNVVLANFMTYSRHYPFLEQVFDTLGRDLPRMIEFFRAVDQRKPPREEVMKREAIAHEKSVAFVKVYEEAIIDTAKTLLAEQGGAGPARQH
jgi:hypothetical protein